MYPNEHKQIKAARTTSGKNIESDKNNTTSHIGVEPMILEHDFNTQTFLAMERNTGQSDSDESAINKGFETDWNFAHSPISTAAKRKNMLHAEGNHDEWNAVRTSAASKIALDKEREILKENVRSSIKKRKLAELSERAEQIREESTAKEAQIALEKKELERQSKKARRETLDELSRVKATVFMEKERDIMNDFEASYMDLDIAGGSSLDECTWYDF